MQLFIIRQILNSRMKHISRKRGIKYNSSLPYFLFITTAFYLSCVMIECRVQLIYSRKIYKCHRALLYNKRSVKINGSNH